MSSNWLTYTSYTAYKNQCFKIDGTVQQCNNIKLNETKNNSNTKKDGNKCKWTNYSDYLKYKNTQLIVQDIDGTHESLTGNSNNINL